MGVQLRALDCAKRALRRASFGGAGRGWLVDPKGMLGFGWDQLKGGIISKHICVYVCM